MLADGDTWDTGIDGSETRFRPTLLLVKLKWHGILRLLSLERLAQCTLHISDKVGLTVQAMHDRESGLPAPE